MNARQIDDAAGRLHELDIESAGDIALAVVATGLALAATQLLPALAMPFLVGAIAVGFLGVRAYVRRTFLVEDLAAEPDAYEIPAVRSFGQRATAVGHRRALARTIRAEAERPRLAPVRADLDRVAERLEDGRRPVDPCALVALEQWLRDPGGSFRTREVPASELGSRLRSLLAALEIEPGAERPQQDQRLP
jgi:hypothetical protein